MCNGVVHLPSTAGTQLRCGTRRQATVVHGPNATLVGSDSFGNKYYQRMTEQYGALHLGVLSGNKAGTRRVVPVCAISALGLVGATRAGRHRWVVYGDLDWPSGQDPTSIPPEWHGACL